MKSKYFWLLPLLFILISCYKEDKLIPSSNEITVRFEFPQGDNSWDKTVEEIAEKFGVYLIYTDFDTTELNRTWTGSTMGDPINAKTLNAEQAEFNINFMKEHIFDNLRPELLARVLPSYIFLAYDIRQPTMLSEYFGDYTIQQLYDGMDFWAFCLEGNPPGGMFPGYDHITRPETSYDYWALRSSILKNISKLIIERENIEIPEKFYNDFDYTTPYLTKAVEKDDPNYFRARGFTGTWNHWTQRDNITQCTPQNNFMDYIHFIMYYTRESAAQEYGNYPKILENYDFVVNYLKSKYNWDISKISEK